MCSSSLSMPTQFALNHYCGSEPSLVYNAISIKKILCAVSYYYYCYHFKLVNYIFFLVDTTSYDSGLTYTVGVGVSLGPYNFTLAECDNYCSTSGFSSLDCRAFAYRLSLSINSCCFFFAFCLSFEFY